MNTLPLLTLWGQVAARRSCLPQTALWPRLPRLGPTLLFPLPTPARGQVADTFPPRPRRLARALPRASLTTSSSTSRLNSSSSTLPSSDNLLPPRRAPTSMLHIFLQFLLSTFAGRTTPSRSRRTKLCPQAWSRATQATDHPLVAFRPRPMAGRPSRLPAQAQAQVLLGSVLETAQALLRLTLRTCLTKACTSQAHSKIARATKTRCRASPRPTTAAVLTRLVALGRSSPPVYLGG